MITLTIIGLVVVFLLLVMGAIYWMNSGDLFGWFIGWNLLDAAGDILGAIFTHRD